MNTYCIGRNYAEHAKELGNAIPDSPIVFLKPTTAILQQPQLVSLPWHVGAIHHEAEVVIRMKDSKTPEAWAIGVDFTAREVQNKAKEKGQPWTFAKGLRNFGPVGTWVPFSSDWKTTQWNLMLAIDNNIKQKGSSEMMLWKLPTLIDILNESFGLETGDLIFTGTPEGVGPVTRGCKVSTWAESGGARSTLQFQCL